MPYLEYPEYLPSQLVQSRTGQELCYQIPKSQEKEEEHARLQMRNSAGWASEKREIYKPLGNPEDLPSTGPELRMKRSQAVRKPRVVLPDKKRGPAEEEEGDGTAIPLAVNTTVRGSITQFHYQYYMFELSDNVRERVEPPVSAHPRHALPLPHLPSCTAPHHLAACYPRAHAHASTLTRPRPIRSTSSSTCAPSLATPTSSSPMR